MKDEERVLKILGDMRDNEELLYAVYGKFAAIFPEQHDFWHEISIEENSHALMVDTFISLYKDKYMLFQDRPLAREDVQEEIGNIKRFLKRLNEGSKISLSSALEFALKTENATVEKEIFKYDESYPEDFKKMARILTPDSKRHVRKIESLYESIRNA